MLFGRLVLLVCTAVALLQPTRAGGGQLPTPTGTPYFPPTPSGLFALTGHVAAGPGCAGNRVGTEVTIWGGRSTVTDIDGRFTFTDLTYGSYLLVFAPDCPLISCYPSRYVFIDGQGDVDIDVCRDDCPATARISRYSGPRGSLVDVSGRCDAARDESFAVAFDDRELTTGAADADGVYAATVTIPPDAAPDVDHRIRVTLGGREIASANFLAIPGAPLCAGDCNADGVVTVNELLRGIRIALGLDQTNTCANSDASSNGLVSIAEVIMGVQRALDGCHLPDLVPLDAHYSRCVDYSCSTGEQVTHFMAVCIANQGDAESARFLVSESSTLGYTLAPALPAGAQECIEMPLTSEPAITVDPSNDVAESDETNNFLATAIPGSTACDVRPPPCTPTPPPTQGPIATPT